MKTRIVTLSILVLVIGFSEAFSQTFNKSTDLLLANFDLKPVEDDIMAAAALGSILAHPDFDGVNYFAVVGTYATQDSGFISDALPDYFNTLFGAENTHWTNADADWNASVNRAKNKVLPVLNAGGKVFVQDNGQSNFAYDVLQAAMGDGVSLSTIQGNVIVVQHSTYNERKTTAYKFDWLKNNTIYKKIADGNHAGNGTPGFRTSNDSFWADGGHNFINFDPRVYGDEDDHEHPHSQEEDRGPALAETMQVQYRGRTFVVDRTRPDYSADQANKIKAIITSEKPPLLFQSYKALMAYYRQLKAPGFGGSTGGFGEHTPLGQFTFISVEIPKHQRFRTFIYRRQGDQGPYLLFDHFYYDDCFAPLLQFMVEGKQVHYVHQMKGKVIRTHDTTKP